VPKAGGCIGPSFSGGCLNGYEHRSHKVPIGYVGLDKTIEVLRRRRKGDDKQEQPLHYRSVIRIRSAILTTGCDKLGTKTGRTASITPKGTAKWPISRLNTPIGPHSGSPA